MGMNDTLFINIPLTCISASDHYQGENSVSSQENNRGVYQYTFYIIHVL
jgi:hypothetical protein